MSPPGSHGGTSPPGRPGGAAGEKALMIQAARLAGCGGVRQERTWRRRPARRSRHADPDGRSGGPRRRGGSEPGTGGWPRRAREPPPRARPRPRRDGRPDPGDGARVRGRGDRAAGGGHRPGEPLPHGPVAEDGGARAARGHGGSGVRRRRARLPRARAGHGGGQPGLGGGGARLRRALEPVREPDPPERERRAEGALPAAPGVRRARGGARHERVGRRLGRGGDEAPGRAAGRPATC